MSVQLTYWRNVRTVPSSAEVMTGQAVAQAAAAINGESPACRFLILLNSSLPQPRAVQSLGQGPSWHMRYRWLRPLRSSVLAVLRPLARLWAVPTPPALAATHVSRRPPADNQDRTARAQPLLRVAAFAGPQFPIAPPIRSGAIQPRNAQRRSQRAPIASLWTTVASQRGSPVFARHAVLRRSIPPSLLMICPMG